MWRKRAREGGGKSSSVGPRERRCFISAYWHIYGDYGGLLTYFFGERSPEFTIIELVWKTRCRRRNWWGFDVLTLSYPSSTNYSLLFARFLPKLLLLQHSENANDYITENCTSAFCTLRRPEALFYVLSRQYLCGRMWYVCMHDTAPRVNCCRDVLIARFDLWLRREKTRNTCSCARMLTRLKLWGERKEIFWLDSKYLSLDDSKKLWERFSLEEFFNEISTLEMGIRRALHWSFVEEVWDFRPIQHKFLTI